MDQLYLTLIETAFHSKNSSQRQEGEKQLFLVAMNDNNAISNLLQLPKYQLEITAFIVSLIKKKLQFQVQGANQYTIQQRIQDVENIRLAFGSNLELPPKQMLVCALQTLLLKDKSKQLESIMINQAKQLFATQQVQQIEQGLYIAQAIVVKEVIDEEFFNQIFQIGQMEQFLLLWQKVMVELIDSIMKQNYEIAQNIILSNHHLAQTLQVQLHYFKKKEFDLDKDYLFIKIVSGLYNKLIKHKPMDFINKSVLFQFYPQIAQICFNTLAVYFQNANFNTNNIKDIFIMESICLMLKFINLGCRQLLLFDFYQNRKLLLILDVIFPLCLATQKDLSDLEHDPEEYIKCQLDIIQYQSSQIPQTAAAELLKSFLYLDGTLTIVFDFAIAILQQAIDPTYQNEILNIIKDKYIINQPKYQQIHMSIQILSIISGFVSDRIDLVLRLTKFVDQNSSIIGLNSNPLIVKLKFTQLIGSYCKQLSKLSNENFPQHLSFLLQFISSEHESVLIYQCVETFRIIVENDENGKFTLPILYELIIKLCTNLKECQYSEVFELILTLISKFKASITEEILQFIVQSLVQKILFEYQKFNDNDRNEIWLNLSFNILKMLPDLGFIPRFTDLIEAQMTEIFNLLQTHKDIQFAEDIFVLLSSIIAMTKQVTATELRVFVLSFNVLEAQFWRLGQLFELYNLIIIHGPHIFVDATFQIQFLQILSKMVLEQNDRINEADNQESLLIFQLLLERVQISVEGVQIIYNTLIKRSELTIVNKFFKSRLYCTFLQLARYVQQYQIYNALQNFQEILYKVIQEIPSCLSRGYDTKIYIIALCEILQQNHQLWNQVANTMVEKLNNQLINEDDDEESKEDNLFEENEIEQEANIILGVFKGKVFREDEFTYFNNMYHSMQKTQANQLQYCSSNPLQINNPHLKKILMTQRVNGKPRQVFTKKLKKQTI